MARNLTRQIADGSAVENAQTVEALVDMLSRTGIGRTRIDALISKASYPNAHSLAAANTAGGMPKAKPQSARPQKLS
ncbi:hypothetical protein GCM10011390_01530 [Aureimonas endophytica]|uniref:Uncharacterized protein n=1 Tax=Aureimonas endophytica TaxID=2027858 RepID=A0A917DZV0_9HYPH|nr:hypothetical protein [Aureimonas endophytica]GGD86617.1 hypothetical protein GCM10011390_01530 [Aureimonas endophytica]